MQRIKELIVVEGKHDIRKLKKLFDCDVICTEGLSMSPEVLDTIVTIGKKRGVIVLTDPDHPGEVIRNRIAEIGKNIDVEIDGGINLETGALAKKAGANVLVAGSTVFNEKDRAKIIKELREN